MNHSKTKDQSIIEFFETLQKEYFVAEIRRKIYPSHKDKRYYEKLMEFKKQRILDIADKNQFLTIFDDEETKKKWRAEVYSAEGLPKFPCTEEDVRNYYLPGTFIRIKEGKEMLVGKIVKTDLKANIVIVKLRGESKERPFIFYQVTRVL